MKNPSVVWSDVFYSTLFALFFSMRSPHHNGYFLHEVSKNTKQHEENVGCVETHLFAHTDKRGASWRTLHLRILKLEFTLERARSARLLSIQVRWDFNTIAITLRHQIGILSMRYCTKMAGYFFLFWKTVFCRVRVGGLIVRLFCQNDVIRVWGFALHHQHTKNKQPPRSTLRNLLVVTQN